MRRTVALLTVALILLIGTIALVQHREPSSGGPEGPTLASPTEGAGTASSSASSAATTTAGVTKVLVIVEENHSVAQLRAGMPYLAGLSQKYGQALNYQAIRHPSEPNYLAIAGGSTFGVSDDRAPSAHPIQGQSVFGQAIAKNLSAATYAQSMSGTCEVTGNRHRGYAVKHNPQAYFVAERAQCRQTNRSDASFRSDAAANMLPTVGFLIPNRCADAHDCSLTAANDYLKKMLEPVLGSTDFTSGRMAVVITADEDDSRGPNYVLTTVLQSGLHAKVTRAKLSHYSLSRLLSQVSGSTPLRSAANAGDLADAFGFRVARRP